LGCLSENTIHAYVEGALVAGDLAHVESHIASCVTCERLVTVAVDLNSQQVMTSGSSTPLPAHPPVARPVSRGTAVGRYTVLGLAGRGGMGDVYKAYDPALDRKVALKLLRPTTSALAAQARSQLLLEAKAIARLSHLNVVTVHDAGAVSGWTFIAMEFVDGQTLSDWLAAAPRSRAEILEAFKGAARGLAAAHAAGLVHRDFKPQNVMVAKDGGVRVMDFGLVPDLAVSEPADRPAANAAPNHRRLGADEEPESTGRPSDPSDPHAGERLETLLFRAPEQFAGGPTDARTDQFSFCVALYRAFYDAAPFRGDTPDVLRANVLAGRVEPAPPKSNVPVWLRRVLIRGLSVDPTLRWSSITDLAVALERDPSRIRRRRALTLAVTALVCLSILTLVHGSSRQAVLCLGGPARLAGIWEGSDAEPDPRSRRKAAEKAFTLTGLPTAGQVWERAAASLDRYRLRWLTMYREACEATSVHHEQSPALLDLRMGCLDERARALSALTNVFVSADSDVVKHAVDAVNALPAIEPCADRQELESPIEPFPDEATRRHVEDLRSRLATAKALNDTGKHNEAADRIRELLVEARATGYRTLVTEALLALVHCFGMGTFNADVEGHTEEAVWTALAIGRDDLAAEASVLLAGFASRIAAFDDAKAWMRLASAILDSAGSGRELLRSWLLEGQADLEYRQHHAEAALALSQRAADIKEKILPPDHPDLALAFNNEANSLAELGRDEEALRLSRRAYDIYVRAYGQSSADAATTLSNSGEYLVALGRPGEALEPLRRALADWEAQIGPDHQFLGYPLTATGRALVALSRPNEAIAPLERALGLREAKEADPLLVAETRFALARALWDANADRPRAGTLSEKARVAYANAKDAADVATVDAWIADRSREAVTPRGRAQGEASPGGKRTGSSSKASGARRGASPPRSVTRAGSP
jgi:eukaryotic-like serine/threonine-protein kinase